MKIIKLLLCICLSLICLTFDVKDVFASSPGNIYLVIAGDSESKDNVHIWKYHFDEFWSPNPDVDCLLHNNEPSNGDEIDGLQISFFRGFYNEDNFSHFGMVFIDVNKDVTINANLTDKNVDPSGNCSAIYAYMRYESDGTGGEYPIMIRGDHHLTINMYSDNLSSDSSNDLYGIGREGSTVLIGNDDSQLKVTINDCIENKNRYVVNTYGINTLSAVNNQGGTARFKNSEFYSNTSKAGIKSSSFYCINSDLKLIGKNQYDNDYYQGIVNYGKNFENENPLFKDSYVYIDSREMNYNPLNNGENFDAFYKNAALSAISLNTSGGPPSVEPFIKDGNKINFNYYTEYKIENTKFELNLNPYQYGISTYGTEDCCGMYFDDCDISIKNDSKDDEAFNNTPVFNIYSNYGSRGEHSGLAFIDTSLNLDSPNCNMYGRNYYIECKDENSGFNFSTNSEYDISKIYYNVTHSYDSTFYLTKPSSSSLTNISSEGETIINPSSTSGGMDIYYNLESLKNCRVEKTYVVNYYANDGKVVQGSIKQLVIPVGNDNNIILPIVQKDYYSFDGWYSDPDFKSDKYTNEAYIVYDTNFYAKYVPLTVNIELNSNSSAGVINCSIVNFTNEINGYEKPIKEGYTLLYWKDNKGNKVLDAEGIIHDDCPSDYFDGTNWKSLGDVKLIAVWDKNQKDPVNPGPSPTPAYVIPKTGIK